MWDCTVHEFRITESDIRTDAFRVPLFCFQKLRSGKLDRERHRDVMLQVATNLSV
jgi:hypothetical protein